MIKITSSFNSASSTSSESSSSETDSADSTLTEYDELYPPVPELNKINEVIDLTSIQESDEECEFDNDSTTLSNGIVMVTNSVSILSVVPTAIAKFVVHKQVHRSKLKKYTPPLAEHLYWSCLSTKSRKHYRAIQENSKETYIGESLNPFVGEALFAAQIIKAGDFIVIYPGLRMSLQECSARQKKGRPSNYALYVGKGIVIDALGFPHGAAMSNHSCRPNARLRHGYLKGQEHAPYGYLQAL